MLYDDLEKDLLELMHEATPMNLNSLINTIRNCEDVKDTRIKRHYSKGAIYSDDGKGVYNTSYLRVLDEKDNEMSAIWFGRADWLSSKRDRYRNSTPIKEGVKLYVDTKSDTILIVSIDCVDTGEEDSVLFYELFEELKQYETRRSK